MWRLTLVALLLVSGMVQAFGQVAALQQSRCHVFIDYDFIWTLEIIHSPGKKPVPILNIITFSEEQDDFRPEQVHLFSAAGKEAKIDRFSIETGVEGEPYLTTYLKLQGSSFIGMDLEGKFDGFEEVSKVVIDVGDDRFNLQPIDCLDFETLAQKINQVNFDSPQIREDFEVLKIELYGKREAVPRR